MLTGRMTHSPRSSATTVPILCPSAVIVTVARGAARPAMTVPPSGFTRTISKLGRIGGGGVPEEEGAGAVMPVDAALEPAAGLLPELPFEDVVVGLLGGAAACAWVFWPVDPSLVEGWLVVSWPVEPWLAEPWLAEPWLVEPWLVEP